MVELRGVSYRVGETPILDDVTLRLSPGRFNVILGPTGAGKSTVVRLATGLARPTSGEVRYGERPIASFGAAELARTRAVLSQHVELAFPLPAIDVVMMGRYPHYQRVASAVDREIVRQALDLVGMDGQRNQLWSTLSGGERQKVNLARVLAQIWPYGERPAHEHRYLYLDEPTNNLDVRYQLRLIDMTRGLLDHDCTVVAVLHDLSAALSCGDHFVLLEAGRVALEAERADDIPTEVLERVFRVRARRIADPAGGGALWRFGL
ncbi:MAG: heme ABC transporter ATP-binding protein [Gemmatimonadaceae bacterium]